MTENTKPAETVAKKPRAKKAVVTPEAAPVQVPAAEAAPVKKPRATKAKGAESSEAKPAAKPRKAAAKKSEKQQVTPSQRHEMVSMAAYFIAERRGFMTGYEHQDWVAAEREIDVRIELI